MFSSLYYGQTLYYIAHISYLVSRFLVHRKLVSHSTANNTYYWLHNFLPTVRYLSLFDSMANFNITLYFRNPIGEYPFYVLVETHGSDESHDSEKLNRFLEKEMQSGLILDGTVTSEPTKMQVRQNFYRCR